MTTDAGVSTVAGTGKDDGSGPPTAPLSEDQAPADDNSSVPWWSRTWVVVVGLTSVVMALPMAYAAVKLRDPRWYPMLDMAQTEMRVRDVGTGDTPLIGLPGRFEVPGPGPGGYSPWQGSHPGPLSFYSLWPFYTLFGASAWALQLAAASLNTVATGLAIWMGKRRGGVALALGVAAGLAVMARFYGSEMLTLAWNPYMPMLWWVVFLLALWSALSDDLAMLPVAVFAGSFCLQTHIPYLGLVLGMGGFLVVTLAGVTWWFRRRDRAAFDARGGLRRVAFWGGAALVFLGVLWAPPLTEQVVRDPGNMTVLEESLGAKDESTAGLSRSVQVWLGHLDVPELLTGSGFGVTDPSTRVGPGLVLLAAWAAAVGWTVRRWWTGPRDWSPLLLLHMVVAAALLLGLVSISRVSGLLWYYLMLWSWGTTTLLLVAVGWSATEAFRRLRPERRRPEWVPRLALGAVAALVVVPATAMTLSVPDEPVDHSHWWSPNLEAIAPEVVDALGSGDLPGGGTEGRYQVWWRFGVSDETGLGDQAYGMLLELERHGFDVGAPEWHAGGVGTHRVLQAEDATAIVHPVVGPCIIERWRNTEGAVLVAEADTRSPEEIERYAALRAEAVEGLEAEGLDDLVTALDRNVFGTLLFDELPEHLEPVLQEMVDLGLPTAVFVTPPELEAPTAAC